ncbi:MAG: hypothetical protein ACRDDY_04760 [Clostridium sp.]|uniref:hypothetical protein n=1 Tax=Clostridium sp. TaxID=1506 RepID=UPI003EE5CDE4
MKNVKMMVVKAAKEVAKVACIVGLTLTVNSMIDSKNDVEILTVPTVISEVKTESTINDSTELEEVVTESIEDNIIDVVDTYVNDSKIKNDVKIDTSNKGVSIKAENWLSSEDDENKDLTGNVIIEDDNSIIEIDKETYDEIEHGENSDLDGDVYIDDEDIINSTTKYTEDDYNRYVVYRESLISEYGQEVYDLMNQEAGLENEEQSFIHFMKYGI